jgi:hypothetical protein
MIETFDLLSRQVTVHIRRMLVEHREYGYAKGFSVA